MKATYINYDSEGLPCLVLPQAASICLGALVVLPLSTQTALTPPEAPRNSFFAASAVPLHCTVCKMHLELTFLCELTIKEDLHGVCVPVGSFSPLPYPALSVSHGLQFHTKHPFPEI